MKKILLAITGVIAAYNSYAQNTLPPSGSVGIGTTNPFGPLTVQGGSIWGQIKILPNNPNEETGIAFSANTSASDFSKMWFIGPGGWGTGQDFVIGTSQVGGPSLLLNTNGNVGIGANNPSVKFQVNSQNSGNNTSTVNWIAGSFGGQTGDRVVIGNLYGTPTIGGHNEALNAWANLVLNVDGGNVGIGTANPDSKLAVKGTIHAQEVKIDMNDWADYVFKPGYYLMPLYKLKTYIDQNQCLPGMPSEQEVTTNGITLGEIVKLQTKKIEELTLYLIEQQTRIANLEKMLDSTVNKRMK